MNATLTRLALGCLALLTCAAGCNTNKPLLLQDHFSKINAAQTDVTQVLGLLPEQGMLHTADAVSVYNKQGWARELGIVQFNPTDSLVKRKIYVQTRSQLGLLIFSQEKLYLLIQTVIPEELLNEPYESDMRKHAAMLRYCHEVLISDLKPFTEDQKTLALGGMARSALREAIIHLSDRPRDAYLLLAPKGFAFDHSIMGRSRLRLAQDKENIFTLTLSVADWVDPVNVW